MCVQLRQGRWKDANRSRRMADDAAERELKRVAARGVTASASRTDTLASLVDAFGETIDFAMITQAHPSHPRCPLLFWQTANVLHRAGQEIAARRCSNSPPACDSDAESSDSDFSSRFTEQGAVSALPSSRNTEASPCRRDAASGYSDV